NSSTWEGQQCSEVKTGTMIGFLDRAEGIRSTHGHVRDSHNTFVTTMNILMVLYSPPWPLK
ncbi:MAG: hypothetical protein WCC92_09115, partial [Candidatus Korobacteraceae bacterium]